MTFPNPPETLTVFVCDRCGRKELSALAIRPGHGWRGERCGGTVRGVEYVAAATADSWWRSRLESDETVEAVAGWFSPLEDYDTGAPVISDEDREQAQAVLARLAALLPVNEPETDT